MATQLSSATVRFHLRLIPEDRRLLESLQTIRPITTKSALIRAALEFLEQVWGLKMKNERIRIGIRNDSERRQYEISLGVAGAEENSDEFSREISSDPMADNLEVRLLVEDISRIDMLISNGAAPSRSQVVREALRVYSHVVKKAAEGWYPAILPQYPGDSTLEITIPGLEQSLSDISDPVTPRPVLRLVSEHPAGNSSEGKSTLANIHSQQRDLTTKASSPTMDPKPEAEGSRMIERVGDNETWIDLAECTSGGVWIAVTLTSCAWPLIYALKAGFFGKSGISVRGVVIRSGWLSNDLEKILVDPKIRNNDVVLVQSLLSDLLFRYGKWRRRGAEGFHLERLRAVAPLSCQELAITARDENITSLHRLIGRTLAVTHCHSNFLMRLCLAMDEQGVPYSLPEEGISDRSVNISYVPHSDLLKRLDERRIDAFATVQPYHKYASDNHLCGHFFRLAPPRFSKLPDYCCVAAVPESHIDAQPAKVKQIADTVQAALNDFRKKKDYASQVAVAWLDEMGLMEGSAGAASRDLTGMISAIPQQRIVTPDELSYEVIYAQQFFQRDEFLQISPVSHYEDLVLVDLAGGARLARKTKK